MTGGMLFICAYDFFNNSFIEIHNIKLILLKSKI